jgi:glycosyltransferase involved in cell wall biosynthesis
MPEKSRKQETPMITVAMPTKNNSSTIQAVLKSLERQDYPKERMQIVFVDGLSRDGTYRKIVSWAERSKAQYSDILLIAEESNIPKARNICLGNAKGDYVLFWDADVVAPPMATRTLLNDMKSLRVGIANHPYYLDHPGLIDKVLKLDEPTNTAYVKAVVMGFTMIKKQLLKKVGYFNETLDGFEDQDFSHRVTRARFKILIDPSVKLKHLRKPMGFGRFVKENFSRRSKYVNSLVSSGSRKQLLRAIYYLLLPLNFLIGVVTIEFVSWRTGTCLLILALAYMIVSVMWHLRRAKKSSYGLLSPIVHLIGGIALAYGMLWQAAKEK